MLQFIACLFFCLLSGASVIDAPLIPVDYQQNPSHVRWMKIDTEHFEIIFAQEISVEAQRVAVLLEKAYPFVTRSLETYPPKISLILQNQSTISNGFVTLAPRRSEWYVTPSIDPELNNTEWLKTLSVHEFRHVVQMQKTRQGFNQVLEILFGEIGQAVGLGLTLPPWFLEGDAVGMETALTNGGRGRLPVFERDLRALLLSDKKYDYDQAHLGSYKNYIPNHYVYGYFYTTFMRNQEGDLFLSHLSDKASRSSYNPLTFYNTYHDLTGRRFEKFYRETMKSLIKTWKEKLLLVPQTPYEVKNLYPRESWTNYLYPQVNSKNETFALKRGLSVIDQFVLMNEKEEETLFYPGILMNEYPYKLRKDRVAFLEWEIDPRWGYRDFSRLKVFDISIKKEILDIRRKKWRLAVLNHTGDQVALVEWDAKQRQSVVVIDLNGKELKRIFYPKEDVITSLDWLSENEIVMVVKDRADFKSVVQLDLSHQYEKILVWKTYVNFGYITSQDGKILVESPESGIDNIYQVQNESLKQLTSSRFGAYAPTLVDGELIYNDYTAEGMNIVKKKMPWDEEQKSSDSFYPFYEKFAQNEKKEDFEYQLAPEEKYKVKKYSQVKKALNLHSWLIFAPPLSNSITLAGISRDLLNKHSLVFGGSYNLNEQTTEGFVSSTWSHYFPVFDLRAGYGGRRQDIDGGGKTIDNKWEEGTFEGGLQVPWKKISGRFIHDFSLRAFTKLIKVTNKLGSDLSEVRDGTLYSPGAHLRYNYFSRLAKRDIYPNWAYFLNLHHEKGRDISGKDQEGSLFSTDNRVFIPGFMGHHSFFQQVAYEKQSNDFYQYPSLVFYPRGTQGFFLQEFVKYSANYTLPLAYPDWHWSRYIYFKRIYLNLFYDQMTGRYNTTQYNLASTGWEFLFDTHFVRFFIPLTFGVRGNYILDGEQRSNYDLFLSTVIGTF